MSTNKFKNLKVFHQWKLEILDDSVFSFYSMSLGVDIMLLEESFYSILLRWEVRQVSVAQSDQEIIG